MKILIDNGHGVDTPGKCSPDRRLLEYKWAREIAKRLHASLKAAGVDAEIIVPEERDVSLAERVRRVNAICGRVGTKNCLLVSIHINAAGGDGKWHTARGWSGWVAPNASERSKVFAQMLYSEASRMELRGNRAVPACRYWIGNFTIIKRTRCAAVLTENLFQDNREDVNYLLSEEGKRAIVGLHLAAIKSYIKRFE